MHPVNNKAVKTAKRCGKEVNFVLNKKLYVWGKSNTSEYHSSYFKAWW
jgi:hypothetical protein